MRVRGRARRLPVGDCVTKFPQARCSLLAATMSCDPAARLLKGRQRNRVSRSGSVRTILANRRQVVGLDTVDIEQREGIRMTATKRCPTCGQPLPARISRRRLRAVAPEARVAASRESRSENLFPVFCRWLVATISTTAQKNRKWVALREHQWPESPVSDPGSSCFCEDGI